MTRKSNLSRKGVFWVAVTAVLLAGGNLPAHGPDCSTASPSFPADESGWTAVLRGGEALTDPDSNGDGDSRDILGTIADPAGLGPEDHPAAFLSADADFIYFRVCLDGDPRFPDACADSSDPGCDLDNSGWMAIFTEELTGPVCVARFSSMVDGKGNEENSDEEEVVWIENSQLDGECTANNENYETEHCTHHPSTHTQIMPVPEVGSFYTCLGWAQPREEMINHGGIDLCNPFRVIFSSNANTRTPNQDELTDVSDAIACSESGCVDCNAQGDTDGDGIGDLCDNCRFVPNADQADSDGDCACVPYDEADPACGDACEACVPSPEGPPDDPTCSDSGDNDCDGLIDLEDPDCQPTVPEACLVENPNNEPFANDDSCRIKSEGETETPNEKFCDVGLDGSIQINVLENDDDADGDPLTIASLSPPTDKDGNVVGTLTDVGGGNVVFQPTVPLDTVDSNIVFSYVIDDGNVACDEGDPAGEAIFRRLGVAGCQLAQNGRGSNGGASGLILLTGLALLGVLRRKRLGKVGVSLVAAAFLLTLSHEAQATVTICFCHIPPPDSHTLCTSNPGEQNGHLNHGDPPFGCECGDGVCLSDPEQGIIEDCGTCPDDCGICNTCGNGIVDGTEQCDGDECCNDDCTSAATAEICDDGLDNDCDGLVDDDDRDCDPTEPQAEPGLGVSGCQLNGPGSGSQDFSSVVMPLIAAGFFLMVKIFLVARSKMR